MLMAGKAHDIINVSGLTGGLCMRKFAAIALLLALLVSGCGGEARQAAESAPPGEIVESYAGTAVTVAPMEPGEEAALLLKNVSAASGEDGLVPVAITVYKDGTDGVISAAPEDYNNPDAFADCDAAYAVTLTFVPQ